MLTNAAHWLEPRRVPGQFASMTDAAIPASILNWFRLLMVALCLTTTPSLSLAEEWTALNAEGITKALTGRTLQYETATQEFRPSGKTLYTTSQESWGNWSIHNGQYCSQWPPSSDWNCYDMYLSDDARTVRFIGAPDDVTDGRYID